MISKQGLARRIYQVSHLTGEFRLRSGMVSNEYFDKYLFEGEPEVLGAIAHYLKELVPVGTDFLAGLEMGGIPVVTMLSHASTIPALFVRKQAKSYGTAKLAEGRAFHGSQLLIVEDVVSTGGQIIMSTNALRDQGANVAHALCVIDRETGGKEKLLAEGIELHSLFTLSELNLAST